MIPPRCEHIFGALDLALGPVYDKHNHNYSSEIYNIGSSI